MVRLLHHRGGTVTRSSLDKRSGISKRSVIIPILLILMLFSVAGFFVRSIAKNFYYEQKISEASLLARGYAETLALVIDAEYQLDQQMQSTLTVAGATLSKYNEPFSNDVLAEMAESLDVDVIYLYDQDLTLIHSSDGNYIGWRPTEGHAIEKFYTSGMIHYVEDIRPDTVSGILYKYGYHRFPDGKMVQVGILAETISELYAQFDPQYLINSLEEHDNHTKIAFLDNEGKILAASSPDYVGTWVRTAKEGLPILFSEYSHIVWEGTPYLVLRMPIKVKGSLEGSMLLFYDMSEGEKLLHLVALIIGSTFFVFFLLFSYTFIHIYRKNKRIMNIAYHDAVTGLPNQQYFQDLVKTLDNIPLACILINPRNFKLVNIMYGYTYGNEILIQIADVLRSLAESQRHLHVFRLSDDRFILLQESEEEESLLSSLQDTLREAGGRNHELGALEFTIGIATSKSTKHDASLLIKQASIALNATTAEILIQRYDRGLEEILIRKDAIEQELKKAINGKNKVLSLAYQPIVARDGNTIHAFEALGRMESESLGTVPPMEFITLAEERHFIIPLGDTILDMATDFLQTLNQLGERRVQVAINISALQVMDEELPHKIASMAREKQISLSQVELELTETIFSGDLDRIALQLKKLRSLGVQISIDDFGTGFSSLSRLGSLDIDILKLDRMFVESLHEKDDQDLVSDIISMAHHLGKQVVAEGVETEAQKEWLHHAMCDFFQGYLFSRPVPSTEALSLLASQEEQNA